MKLNKKVLAAALAFAFVAPTAQAASVVNRETGLVKLPLSVVEKVTKNGREFTKDQFQAELDKANKLYNEQLQAESDLRAYQDQLKTAQARLDKAVEALKPYTDTITAVIGEGSAVGSKNQAVVLEQVKTKTRTEYERAQAELLSYLSDADKQQFNADVNWTATKVDGFYRQNSVGAKWFVDQAKANNANVNTDDVEKALSAWERAYTYNKEADKIEPKLYRALLEEFEVSLYERDRIQSLVKETEKKVEDKRKALRIQLDNLKDVAVIFGAAVVVENDGVVVVADVKDAPAKTNKPAAKVTAADLQRQVDKSEAKLEVIEQMRKKNPKLYSHVEKELDALVAEQKANLKSAKALLEKLNKKAAFSLVSTAYASEEEVVTDEEIQAEIDKLQNTDKKIEDLEAKQEEKVEEAEKEDDADDKKEDKKEDDADDKKEDKKEETKVVEKKKVVTTTKKAGSNAKTGIAGVAGVAGVLAAASVAYAASKKN